MNSPAATLSQVAADLREVLSGDALAGLSDAERAEVLRGFGELSRLVEAGIVEAVATADVNFGHRFGCRGMNELLQRALLTDSRTASKITKAADLVHRDVNITSGERMPARWPALREALLDGAIGIPGLLAATAPLEQARDRISTEERLWADESLAAYARGERLGDDDADADADADYDAASGTDAASGDGDADSGDGDDCGADAGADATSDAGAGDAGVPGPPATAEDLRQIALILGMALDEDGAEPTDRDAQSRRYLNLGPLRNGRHRIDGNITPEFAAQLQLIFDAFNNPKVGGAPAPGVAFHPTDSADSTGRDDDTDGTGYDSDGAGDGRDGTVDDREGDGADAEGVDEFNSDPRGLIDPRTAGQKRHDALAAALGIAARHHDMPTLGGAAPTLVVHVDLKDFAAGTGWATVGAGTPVPLSVAHHTACTGTIQRVLFDEGRIIGITTTDRVFTVHQRRAIIARDKECLIPGCHVPAEWCEIHHVIEHAKGGPTCTDNGVPVCWYHHRSLDDSGWEIRMNNGVPQIRGPEWWDRDQQWRTPRPSLPTRPPRRTVRRT